METGAPSYIAGIGNSGDEAIFSDLSLNENRLGPSSQAIQAFIDTGVHLWKYPEGSYLPLKKAIADHFGVSADRITCGAGAEELIALLTRLFGAPGREVVFPEFSFIMFSLNALKVGAAPVIARAVGFAASVEGIVERITERTSLVFLANPNNPTGTYLLRDDIRRIADRIPPDIPFVLDVAYAEYVDSTCYSDGLDLVEDFPNLVVLRSFSKIYGLASLRIGWCYASRAVVDRLERIRGPYNVSGAAQAAAIAALGDQAHIEMSRNHNRYWRRHLTDAFPQLRLRVEPSGGNFLMAVLPTCVIAKHVYRHLRTRGVLTRQLDDYRLSNCLRITIGTTRDNELLLQSLHELALNQTELGFA
jgi:histidinol-phosphate aminotransferase